MQKKSANSTAAMTLIELLVVAAVLGVLMSLTLPAVSRAKDKSKLAPCMSNLKQLGMAWVSYADDNSQRLACNDAYWTDGYWRSASNSWAGFSSALADSGPDRLKEGTLWRYVGAADIYRCPSVSRSASRTYSLNGNLGGRTSEVQRVVIAMADIEEPARLLNMVCESRETVDDGHFLVWPYPVARWVNMPSGAHGMNGSFAFCDGHAEHWRWLAAKVFEPKTEYWKEAADPKDLMDLRRLQERVLKCETK